MYRSHSTAGVRPLTRLIGMAGAVLLAALAGPFLSTASADPSAGCVGRGSPSTCTVIEPNVLRPTTEYPTIQFMAGDRVSIEAGGCVQTGGFGLTWKRYIDPAANNDLYHGLIGLPGYGLVRLQQVVNKTITIPQGGNLVLGYEDDVYGNNGYWGHDNGTGNQCVPVPNNPGGPEDHAWVRLTVRF